MRMKKVFGKNFSLQNLLFKKFIKNPSLRPLSRVLRRLLKKTEAIKKLALIFAISLVILVVLTAVLFPVISQTNSAPKLYVAYPPKNHQTQSERIFFIGSAPAAGNVFINGDIIKRNQSGHFAPSLPLQLGVNKFRLVYKKFGQNSGQNLDQKSSQNLDLVINRQDPNPLPTKLGFLAQSLVPKANVTRPPTEEICFEAIATPGAKVQVKLASQIVPLLTTNQAQLPPNSAILVDKISPRPSSAGLYRGCALFSEPGALGKPEFTVFKGDQSVTAYAPGSVTILANNNLQAQVISTSGIARTGAGSDFSRLTTLPQGTIDKITATDGDWLRLSYGGWIEAKSLKIFSSNAAPTSIVRSFKTQKTAGWTELVIPLQVPVPVSIIQGDQKITLTLHNTTAQTDTNLVNDDPIISRIDWRQTQPNQVEYIINLKSLQQWGYKLRYDSTTLVLSLRHPPQIDSKNPLKNQIIFLDPGHGSKEDLGAKGPTGFPEKDATLIVGKLLQQELTKQGAKVIMSRNGDDDLFPNQRAEMIEKVEPTIALSLHYNALPDDGDAETAMGIGAFWYHAQSHSLANFLHNYLIKDLKRASYGTFWNNLALARPTVAPSVLLELGFMINPQEFDWIVNPGAQQKLTKSLSRGISDWFLAKNAES